MIRLGLRLTLNGGREAALRLVATAAAVALGVGLLLFTLSGINAINAQDLRGAWLNSGEARPVPTGRPGSAHGAAVGTPPAPPAVPATSASTSAVLWWRFTTDYYQGQKIDRIDVAAAGPQSPLPPGLPHLPGPGQYYASPAMLHLLENVPAGLLSDRYPGTKLGAIGAAALPSPDSLIIVVGSTPSQLMGQGAVALQAVNTDPNANGPSGLDNNSLQTVLAVGALALLFPVLVFIGTATRLSAARREQRFAALRLVGATPRQVSVISAVEASVAGAAGVAGGFAAFLLARPAITTMPITGQPFAPGDLSLNLIDILAVVLGVPLAAAAAARVAMHRVNISPLGVSRRVTPSAPRAYRVLPLLAGVVELVYFVAVGRPATTGGQTLAYFTGCFLVLAGLVVAGPWLTMVGSRIMARRSRRAEVLLAGRRLSDNPRAAFRSISGLIIALFATSVSVGVITTIIDYNSVSGGAPSQNTLLEQFVALAPSQAVFVGGSNTTLPTVPASLLAELRAIPGLEGITEVHAEPGTVGHNGPRSVLISCASLAATPGIGRCAPGATVAMVNQDLAGALLSQGKRPTLQNKVWPAADLPLQQLQALPVEALVVETAGSKTSLEQARTDLEVAFPQPDHTETLTELSAQNLHQVVELQQMTDVVIVVSLIVAGCSLAVSVTGGISERKRPFSLLRLTGVPVRALRRVVALEAAVPLISIAVVAIGTGFVTAALFLNSQLGESLQAPNLSYYLYVGGGMLASLAIIAATMPIIERITGPEVARNE